jgi:hypothetical protein
MVASMDDERDRPPARWEVALDERFAVQTAARRHRRRRLIAVGGGLAALAAIALIVVASRVELAPAPALELTTIRIASAAGAAVRPGDRLQLRATVPTTQHPELALYRAGALILRCAPDDAATPGCRRDGDRVGLEHPLDAPGPYRAVLRAGGVELDALDIE